MLNLQVAWPDVTGLVHGFLGRRGGLSQVPYDRLNLSYRVGDDRAVVDANWNILRKTVPGQPHFFRLHQVHGDEIVVVDSTRTSEPEADGAITNRSGEIVGVLTADCVPILLLDEGTKAVAAVHAGWRGTAAGIVARAVQMLEKVYATDTSRLRAALGPSIGGCCYEVSPEIVDAVQAGGGEIPGAVSSGKNGRPHLDLRTVNAHLLRLAGVEDIVQVGPCTRCASAEYFSHREACRPGKGGITGRQLSFIGWA